MRQDAMATTSRVLVRALVAGDGLEPVDRRLARSWRRADRFVRQQPLRLLAVAAGLGYAVGWLLPRRR
jgi:ElaB/YqjD/DUF883 family membrane-anchored ribosome-binding protein